MAVQVASSLTSTVTLSDGASMPLFGLGFSCTDSSRAVNLCAHALRHGYRLLDTATRYGNEELVGAGLQQSCIPREQVFISTKLWNHGRQAVTHELQRSLDKLGTSYVDLYLIHHAMGGQVLETYDAIWELHTQGLVRSVGVSNFNIHHLEALREAGRPTPIVNQIELHPWKQQNQVVEYCRQHGITVMGYSPMAKFQRADDPTIVMLAKKYKKTVAQIMIRWSVQHGYITIPKTSSVQRVEENAAVFDFNLSEDDLILLATLDENYGCTWEVMHAPWIN